MTGERRWEPRCERSWMVHALADGELAADEVAETRRHLATCEECAAELAEVVQLAAVVAPVARREADKVVPLHKPRASAELGDRGEGEAKGEREGEADPIAEAMQAAKRQGPRSSGSPRAARRALAFAAVAMAASAAAYAVNVTRTPGEPGTPDDAQAQQLAMALPAERALEARLSWRAAAGHRPYHVARSAEQVRAAIPLGALADLERQGDVQGVGVLALLNGDHRQAQAFLERADAGADAGAGVLADRAALALSEGDAARALELCDRALQKDPAHAAATWNRALALRELGLSLAAAASFRRVAAQNEAGWATEASARALALEADAGERRGLTERVLAAGPRLAAEPSALSVEDARRLPGMSRLFVYDALRAATAAQQPALRALVEAVDGPSGGGAVASFARRAAAIAAARPELAATYAEIVAGRPPTGQARRAYLAALRAAGAHELLLGALIRLSPSGRVVAEGELPELEKLTSASADPWMKLLGAEQRAQVALAAEQLPAAEAILLRARARCQAGGAAAPAFRCIKLGLLLGEVYARWHRVAEARAELLRAWKLARAEREWIAERQALEGLASLSVVADDATGSQLPLTRAYTEELALRQPGQCAAAVWGHTLLALSLLNQLRVAEAREELASAPACEQPMPPADVVQDVFVRVHLAREAKEAREVAALRARIADLRADPALPPAQRAMLDHCEGRLVIDEDPDAGAAILRRTIAAARQLATVDAVARRAVAFSSSVLALAEARRGAGASALAALADEQGVTLPEGCVLGVAVEDKRRMAVARDRRGQWQVHYDEARVSPVDDARELVPADVLAALRDCPVVDVLARPPLHGAARLLPDDLAWRYRSARRAPLPAAAPAAGPTLIVADVEPPASLGLPRLASWEALPGAASASQRWPVSLISGSSATPERVLAALAEASEVVIHAHGIGGRDAGAASAPDSAFLALSADAAGNYALTAGAVRAATLRRHPLVVLAACSASQSAPVLHEPWSLPSAFVLAGARAVVASAAPIPDLEAGEFFDGVRAAVAEGALVAVALRDARVRWLAAGRGEWVRDISVFE